MVLADFLLSNNLRQGKRLAFLADFEALGLHHELGSVTDNSTDFLVHEENFVHYFFLWGLRDFAIFVCLGFSCADDYHTLVKTVQDILEVIPFHLGFMSL